MKNEEPFKTIEEAYLSIYEDHGMHDLAKQDPREAFPHKDDMEDFENETEEDLYDDENKLLYGDEESEEDCGCGGDDEEECTCEE
jgi:hypothetical protein